MVKLLEDGIQAIVIQEDDNNDTVPPPPSKLQHQFYMYRPDAKFLERIEDPCGMSIMWKDVMSVHVYESSYSVHLFAERGSRTWVYTNNLVSIGDSLTQFNPGFWKTGQDQESMLKDAGLTFQDDWVGHTVISTLRAGNRDHKVLLILSPTLPEDRIIIDHKALFYKDAIPPFVSS